MKTFLFGSTAIVAVALVTAQPVAAAEKIQLGLGGFMHQWVGYADNDYDNGTTRDHAEFDQQQAGEIYFKGATKLDNGLTVSVLTQLYSDAGSTSSVDESWVKISSETFGTLGLGGMKSAAYQARHKAPNVSGMGINGGNSQVDQWIIAPGAVTHRDNTGGRSSDYQRVVYFTPAFYGLRFGASHAPENTSNGNGSNQIPDRAAGEAGISTAALEYEGKLGGVGVGLNAGYILETGGGASTGARLRTYDFGLNLKYAGFTIGGSYDSLAENDAGYTTATASLTGSVWDIGVAYATGPYGVSLAWTHSESEGLRGTAANDEADRAVLGGSYNLGPGVDWKLALMYADYQDESVSSAATAANHNDGWGVATGMALKF